jgi:CobQ-like glutamine amidotransferase family enzyme
MIPVGAGSSDRHDGVLEGAFVLSIAHGNLVIQHPEVIQPSCPTLHCLSPNSTTASRTTLQAMTNKITQQIEISDFSSSVRKELRNIQK